MKQKYNHVSTVGRFPSGDVLTCSTFFRILRASSALTSCSFHRLEDCCQGSKRQRVIWREFETHPLLTYRFEAKGTVPPPLRLSPLLYGKHIRCPSLGFFEWSFNWVITLSLFLFTFLPQKTCPLPHLDNSNHLMLLTY